MSACCALSAAVDQFLFCAVERRLLVIAIVSSVECNGFIAELFFSACILVLKTDSNCLKCKKPLEHKFKRLFVINMAATYSPALWCSTIGHEGLNFSVRNGKR